MAQVRIIKKYPNRRLYDTEISSYITLEDVRQLIVEGEEVLVRDARTGADLTRVVLMQIIAEQEPQEEPIFTNALDRKSTRLNSSHVKISYAVFCLKRKKKKC